MSAITAESLLLFDDGDRKEILIDTNQRGDPGVQAALMDLMNKHPGIKHRFVTLSDLREAEKAGSSTAGQRQDRINSGRPGWRQQPK
jgi:hypothetical protein